MFLFFDFPTLKLRIIIIMPTDRPNIILATTCTMKNEVAFALEKII